MVKEDNISDEKYEYIKNNIYRFSYVDLVVWRNEMIVSGAVNNRLFNLLNDEIKNRANEAYSNEEQKSK